MRPVAAPSCGPEGRQNKPYQHPERNQGSRQDAGVDGVSGFTGRAAGRGVDAQVEHGHRAIRAKA